MKINNPLRNLKFPVTVDESGAVLIMVTVLLVVFLGFVALALDVGHLYVVKNELQNAADAGALAGARELYLDDGSAVDIGANQVAYDAATANYGMNIAVEVNNPLTNTGDVQRGHWSFANQTFTANSSTVAVPLWDVTTAELDANTDFINAVRVFVRRENIPTKSFFAGLFGFDSVAMGAEAIAYIGFAGTTEPGQVDQPIALCSRSIIDTGGEFTCSRARMLNSSGGADGNTAAWTNFTQDPCATASASSVRPYSGCPHDVVPGLTFGMGMGTTGGTIDNALREVEDCWNSLGLDTNGDGLPDQGWELTLPVINCSGNNPGNCETLLGVVDVEVLWVKRNNGFNDLGDIPLDMTSNFSDPPTSWSCTYDASDFVGASNKEKEDMNRTCFQEFATAFNMTDWDGTPFASIPDSATKKALYFAPQCRPNVPGGGTGGVNFGILAEIPVLVD
jgi:Flp pilus assembly protein TadG